MRRRKEKEDEDKEEEEEEEAKENWKTDMAVTYGGKERRERR